MHALAAAFSAGVKYSAVADEAAGAGFDVDDGLDRSNRELLPFDPLPSSQDDIQLDDFVPLQHYLPKRNKRQAPVSYWSVSVTHIGIHCTHYNHSFVLC